VQLVGQGLVGGNRPDEVPLQTLGEEERLGHLRSFARALRAESGST
jgi:hypothetical protein